VIADLKPYPAYVDSGISWLGGVPEAWNVLRARHMFEIKRRIAGELGHPVLSVTQSGLRIKDVNSGKGQVSLDYSKYQVVCPGEFVMNSMDLLTGGVGIADAAGVTSPDYRVFTIRDAGQYKDRYALHVLRMLYANRGFYAWGQGSAQLGRWRLPRKRFNEFPFPVPPLPEQSAIVRFLDHADRRIRRYVAAKRKLIALLNEQKLAIIHRAVTRGIDPNVRLKPSGVEWLGDVPEHWEVRKLRQCGTIKGGMTPSMEVRQFWDGDIPWVTPKDMKSSVICNSLIRVTNAAIEQTGLAMIAAGAVLLVVRGMILARRVPIAWTNADVTINQDMKALILGSDISPQFMASSLESAQEAFAALIDEAGHGTRRLPTERWRDLAIALPPLDEQRAIVGSIEGETQVFMTTTAKAQREIDLLREYRTRLIADVVTGKLDVREAAASLPDGADEPEELEEADILAEASDELEDVAVEGEALV